MKKVLILLIIASNLFSKGSRLDLLNAKEYQERAWRQVDSDNEMRKVTGFEAYRALAYGTHFELLSLMRNIQLIVDNCHAIKPYEMAATLASIYCDSEGKVVGLETFYKTGKDTDAEMVKALETWDATNKDCESCDMLKAFLDEKVNLIKKARPVAHEAASPFAYA